MTGVTRCWYSTRFYGQILGDDGVSYFVHRSELIGRGALMRGERVAFVATDRGKGPRAVDVRVIDAPAAAPAESQ